MEMMLEMLKAIQSIRTPLFNQVFQWITMLGEDTFFIVLVTVVYWCIHKNFGYKMGLAYLTSAVINVALKETFRIPRPFQLDEEIIPIRESTAGGYSFPSGHSQCASSLLTSLMIQLKKRWFYWFGALLIGLIAFSRMYLGVHTPMDVIAGVALGVGWVFVSNALFDYAERTERRELLLLLAVPILIAMFFIQISDFYKIAGTVIGFIAGYVTESRYIHYKVQAPLWKQAVKVIIGLLVLIAIKSLGKDLLGSTPFTDFIRYFLMGIWTTVLAPLLFKMTLSARE